MTLAIADRDNQLGLSGASNLPADDRGPPGPRRPSDEGPDRPGPRADGSFIVARAVTADDSPNAPKRVAIVASLPTTIVDDTRTDLFKTLFLVALAAALTAFVIAVIVGERIGTGIRRLTLAAREIQGGDLSVRAAMSSRDEVGVLGQTFDSMAGSIETLASELRQSAEEEAQVRNRLEAVVGGHGRGPPGGRRRRSHRHLQRRRRGALRRPRPPGAGRPGGRGGHASPPRTAPTCRPA